MSDLVLSNSQADSAQIPVPVAVAITLARSASTNTKASNRSSITTSNKRRRATKASSLAISAPSILLTKKETAKRPCTQCTKILSSDRKLRDHVAKKHDPKRIRKPYLCPICNHGFSELASVRRHVVEMPGCLKKGVCQYCQQWIDEHSAYQHLIREPGNAQCKPECCVASVLLPSSSSPISTSSPLSIEAQDQTPPSVHVDPVDDNPAPVLTSFSLSIEAYQPLTHSFDAIPINSASPTTDVEFLEPDYEFIPPGSPQTQDKVPSALQFMPVGSPLPLHPEMYYDDQEETGSASACDIEQWITYV